MVDRTAARLQDVAERAGVSLATASRMLGDPTYGGRAGLRERVMAAAEALGYRPNPHARALATSTSSNVGLVVHDVRDAYFAHLSGGAIGVAERHDLLVSMVCTYRDPHRELEYVERLAAQRVRAIILTGTSFRDRSHAAQMTERLEAYQAAGGSVVSVSRGRSVGHMVEIDNVGGMRQLAHALVEQGHESFAMIAGSSRLLTVQDRVKGFKLGLKDHGIELGHDDILTTEMSREGGVAGAELISHRRRRPTCIVGVADVVAIGAISWLHAHGFDVPGDISVAGFGGIPAAIDSVPPLTTFELPLEHIGQTAMELALRPPSPRHMVEMTGELRMRESTRDPRS